MAVRYGSLPFREQVQFFRAKVNLPTQAWTDVWRDQHDTAFMVAGAYKAELLADFRAAVDKAIADGTTLQEFRRDFDAIVQRHGWSYNGSRGWRTRVIYETNLRTSYQAGRFAQLSDPRLQRTRPYWEYVHNDSVRFPRPLHVSWDGLILRADDPWWRTHFPPNGWGCKCKVFARGERDLRRRGKSGPDSAPSVNIVEKTVGVRGPSPRTVQLPEGIDPGFDYTPGRTVADRLRTTIEPRAAQMPGRISDDLVDAIDSPPAAPPAPPVQRPAAPTFSTVRGVDEDALVDKLLDIPDAGERVSKLAEFLAEHPVSTIVVKQVEMGRGQRARELAPDVAAFLGVDTFQASLRYRTRSPTAVNGFTAQHWDTVTVKAKASDKVATARGEDLAAAVDAAARQQQAGASEWSMRATFDRITGGKQAGLVVTWIHELAHQVHFWAGDLPRPAGLPALTTYSGRNDREWHAEHFTAWLLNRDALAAWNQEVAEHFDTLIERAITSTAKPR